MPDEVESFQTTYDVVHNIKSRKVVSKEQMLLVATLPHNEDQFFSHMKGSLLLFKDDPILSMLDVDLTALKQAYFVMEESTNPEVSNLFTYLVVIL